MSNGTTTTRITVDLSPLDLARLEELADAIGAVSRVDALRQALRRCSAISKLGPDPAPETVKVALSL